MYMGLSPDRDPPRTIESSGQGFPCRPAGTGPGSRMDNTRGGHRCGRSRRGIRWRSWLICRLRRPEKNVRFWETVGGGVGPPHNRWPDHPRVANRSDQRPRSCDLPSPLLTTPGLRPKFSTAHIPVPPSSDHLRFPMCWVHLKVPHRGLPRASARREAAYLGRISRTPKLLKARIGAPGVYPSGLRRSCEISRCRTHGLARALGATPKHLSARCQILV